MYRGLCALHPVGEALVYCVVGDFDFCAFLGLCISLRIRRRGFGNGEGGFGEGFGGGRWDGGFSDFVGAAAEGEGLLGAGGGGGLAAGGRDFDEVDMGK